MNAQDSVTSFAGTKRHLPGPAGSTLCGGRACEQGDLLASGERATQALIDGLGLCRVCRKTAEKRQQ